MRRVDLDKRRGLIATVVNTLLGYEPEALGETENPKLEAVKPTHPKKKGK